jgi:hypothetical protein
VATLPLVSVKIVEFDAIYASVRAGVYRPNGGGQRKSTK